MNSINIIGELSTKPYSFKVKEDGCNFCWFYISAARPYLNKKQEKIYDKYFCRCVYKQAEYAKTFCKEGMTVSISGHLEEFDTKFLFEDGKRIIIICCDRLEIIRNEDETIQIAKNKSKKRKRKAAAVIPENNEDEIEF